MIAIFELTILCIVNVKLTFEPSTELLEVQRKNKRKSEKEN